jgi:hypothetical protein
MAPIDFCLLDGTDMKSLTCIPRPLLADGQIPDGLPIGLLIQFTQRVPYGAMYDWVGLLICSYIPVAT